MLRNETREHCRDIGLYAEYIMEMSKNYDEPKEKFRKSLLYKPEFEDKENMIRDMDETVNSMIKITGQISVNEVQILYNEYGISIGEYMDMLKKAFVKRPYNNTTVKNVSDAMISIMSDIINKEIRDNEIYKKIAKGERSENVQI